MIPVSAQPAESVSRRTIWHQDHPDRHPLLGVILKDLRLRFPCQHQSGLYQEDGVEGPCGRRVEADGRANLGIPELGLLVAPIKSHPPPTKKRAVMLITT